MYSKITLILIFLLFSLHISTSQNYIKYFYQPKDLTIEKGKYNETFFVFENTHNESIFMVKLRYQIPSNFVVYQSEVDEILPKQKKSLKLNISTTANEGLYNLTFWAEAVNEINGNKPQSQKYTLPVLVISSNKTITTTSVQTTKINTTLTTVNLNQTTKTTTTAVENIKNTINPTIRVILIAIIVIFLVIIFVILSR
ncbi:MAG: hypothetical protein QXZ43_02455 [Candidatus Aenigmatarchaeota archaeon]